MDQNRNTELQPTQATKELATQDTAPDTAAATPTLNLPVLACPEEIMEATQENLADGESFRLDKVKMPSAGGLTFQITDESGKPVPVQTLTGIILGFQHFKSWYEKAYEEKGADDDLRPDCFSADTVTGTGCTRCGIPINQLCETCSKNAWGSDRRGGRGKDCADRTRVWLLQEGCAMPIILDLPKTSIGPFKEYRKRLTQKAKVIYGVVTAITLEQDTSDRKVPYSKANFAKVSDLIAQERATIKEYIKSISSIMTISQDSISDDHPIESAGDAEMDNLVKNMTGSNADGNEPY
jgi:ribosomal protein L15